MIVVYISCDWFECYCCCVYLVFSNVHLKAALISNPVYIWRSRTLLTKVSPLAHSIPKWQGSYGLFVTNPPRSWIAGRSWALQTDTITGQRTQYWINFRANAGNDTSIEPKQERVRIHRVWIQQLSHLFFHNSIIVCLCYWIGCAVVIDVHVPVFVHTVVESVLNAVLCTRLHKIPGHIACFVPPFTVLDRVVVICYSWPQKKPAKVIQCENGIFCTKTSRGLQPLISGQCCGIKNIWRYYVTCLRQNPLSYEGNNVVYKIL